MSDNLEINLSSAASSTKNTVTTGTTDASTTKAKADVKGQDAPIDNDFSTSKEEATETKTNSQTDRNGIDSASEKENTKTKSNGETPKKESISLKEALEGQAREDEEPHSNNFTLKKIIGGEWLTTEFLKRQIGVILLVVLFTIIYISNRYSCQKNMLEIDKLKSELVDAKYRALSSSSQLTEKCRESNVLKMLKNNKDSVLKTADQPPYIIYVPNEHKTTTIKEP